MFLLILIVLLRSLILFLFNFCINSEAEGLISFVCGYPVVPAPCLKEDQIFLIEQKVGQTLGYEWDSALCVILASHWWYFGGDCNKRKSSDLGNWVGEQVETCTAPHRNSSTVCLCSDDTKITLFPNTVSRTVSTNNIYVWNQTKLSA